NQFGELSRSGAVRPSRPASVPARLIRSMPEQKLGPSPRSTTARTPGSPASCAAAAMIASNMARSNALCFSARARLTSATWSSISIRTRSWLISPAPYPSRHQDDRVPDADSPRLDHLAIDPERQRLDRLELAAVIAQDVERREVDLAAVWIAGGDQAPPDVAVEGDPRRAHGDPAADPVILGVGGDAVDLDQHPKPAHGAARLAGPLGEAMQRSA